MNFLHLAVQKLHWSPSQIAEWLDAPRRLKAFYYASVDVKGEQDKEEAKRLKGRRK